MTLIVLGFALMATSTIVLLIILTLHRAGRLAKRRWQVVRWATYLMALGSLIALSDDHALGPARWWLPLAVFAAISLTFGIPLHVWSRRERMALLDRSGVER